MGIFCNSADASSPWTVGLDKKWAHWIIKSVGNYGEIYEKYMGSGPEGIGIARKGSPNDLWTRGGLMYSPPFR